MIFEAKYRRGMREVDFEREDIVRCASELKIALPKNLGDLVYSFRYRAALPETIQKSAGKGYTWIIRGVGTAKYPLVLVAETALAPNPKLAETTVPDATPPVAPHHALSDAPALLTRL